MQIYYIDAWVTAKVYGPSTHVGASKQFSGGGKHEISQQVNKI